MITTLYATYRADRFGKLLTIRDHDPEPLASIPFSKDQRVTFKLLADVLAGHGFVPTTQWRPVRRTLRADLTRIPAGISVPSDRGSSR